VTSIDFIYFDAGGGHRSAATALKAVIDNQKLPWNVRLVNLQEVLHSLDVFRKVTGIPLEDIYNKMLARGWTFGSAQGLRFMQGVVRLNHGVTTKLLTRHWLETKPDMVVSLVPNFNRTMYQGLRAACPKVPYATILTDFADYPPHFWIEAKQDQYFICGTEKAYQQARSLGHAEKRVFRTSGMILRPSFYEPITIDRKAERARLGLDPEKPTGLVLFGGQGSKVMLDIDRSLDDVQLIFICGKNASLAEKLKSRKTAAKRVIEGFTKEIPYYMHLADFFIGKPGPGSISEAVAMKLPVIVQRNFLTLPQELYNTDWVLEQGAGFVVPSFGHVRQAVSDLLASLEVYRTRVALIHNRAVFEIVDILSGIVS
jgi:UDP-N-acetylglucosamine:LPS N-acetylglucosamine transferase